MSLVSNSFLLFVLAAVLLYYLIPLNYRWLVLLGFSMLYYAAGGVQYFFFIFFSVIVTYGFARWIAYRRERGGSAPELRRLLITGLVLNLGMLGVIKYTNFVIDTLNGFLPLHLPGMAVLFPLGISFYTFQSSGYLIDVYWNKTNAEKNFLHYTLFVSFFPHIMQGPIGKYDRLSHQLIEGHRFDMNRIRTGVQRMIWGLAKKMILADWAGVFADAVWEDPERYSGLALVGMLFYAIQIYADFSGAMDVVIGIADLFGVSLDENFRRPYLAVSLADFWRRWHITLGRFMREYVFYPLSLSSWMKNLTRKAKKRVGKKIGRVVPIAVSDILIFLLVGIWHGASWKYVAYGLVNGLILAFSELMSGVYVSWKKALHISGKENWYHFFQILRTFLVVCFTMYYERSADVAQAHSMLRLAFTRFAPAQLLDISAGTGGTAFVPCALLILAAGCVIMVGAGVIDEFVTEGRLLEKMQTLPFPLLVGIWLLLFVMIGLFGCTAAPKGFIYAQF